MLRDDFAEKKSCSQIAKFRLLVTETKVKPQEMIAPHADVLRGSSRVPAPRTSAELKDKFLFHCSQISAGDHMQIIGDPITVVEDKVLTS